MSKARSRLHALWHGLLRGTLGGRSADAAAVAVVLALTAVGAWGLVVGGTMVGMDAATQFYPWYSFLGESLRSFELPGWNPHQFSGAPFAADPLSGWSYGPAMVFFALLPLSAAAKAYLVFHLLLAGLSVYALARALGIGVAGALFSAVSYEYGSFLYTENVSCFAYASVMAWLPLALLGAEMAIRNPKKLGGAAWLGLSGLALSQVLAAWLGQGSYYALLALGGYVAYRTLISPPAHLRRVRARLLGAVLHGGAVLLFGFGLAAAGLLPRLEYNALSNLAGGYLVEDGEGAVEIGGWERGDWGLLLEPGLWYAGSATLALALLAVPLARWRFAVPYFAGLSLAALVLSGQGPSPLHSVLYLLPRFDQLHPHNPERVVMLLYLGLALLAGAALSRLGERSGNLRFLLLPAMVLAVALAGSLAAAALVALVFAGAILVAYALLPSRRAPILALLIAVVFVDLLSSGRAAISSQGDVEGWVGISGITRKMDLADYYRPSGALRFLMSREGQFRYFGFGLRTPEGRTVSSPTRFAHPETQALGVGNRAMTVGLQSIQGYNAVHLARYDEYVRTMNGGNTQDYHHADVLREGPESPLLDLLGARYVVVPTDPLPRDREYLQELEREFPVVYEDGDAKVLENRGTLPRAWIVHRARQADASEALRLLETGEVRPQEMALVEAEPPPRLDPSASPSGDRASVTAYEADRVEIEAATGGNGLLVLGEVHYPAWRAYLDGEPAPIYRADGLFRAVALPAGRHTVEFRYESRTLHVGTAISVVAYAALAALGVAAGARQRRERAGATKRAIAREGS